jgi:DNA repair ATPase RecN
MPAVLSLLEIKNLALVEELEWQMERGFIAVTGETGAGKSILLERCNFCSVSARTNRSFASGRASVVDATLETVLLARSLDGGVATTSTST